MTELKWDNAKSFPYNVTSAATENEELILILNDFLGLFKLSIKRSVIV